MDGVDLSPALLRGAPSPRDTFAFWRDAELYAFRKGPWKAHFITRGAYGRGPARVVHEVPELYHLGNDPGERWNVAAANRDVLREVTALQRLTARTLRPASHSSTGASPLVSAACRPAPVNLWVRKYRPHRQTHPQLRDTSD
jgi:uncharacterized sulfatase